MWTYSRTFTKGPRVFWPKLIATYAWLGWSGSPGFVGSRHPWYPWAPRTLITFFLFEGPKGRYGPREAWAHMGWVGHPAH